MKKLSFIVMACLMVLSLTQCKKNEPANDNADNGDRVSITLKLENGGQKAHPEENNGLANIVYDNEDVVYVGSDGKYMGILTYNGSLFTGSINAAATAGEPLQFIFMGGQDVTANLTENSTTEYTFSLANQSTSLGVVSCAASNEDFSATNLNYTAYLRNKCALVKFDLGDVSIDDVITLTGVKNELVINFDGTVTTNDNTGNIATYGTGATRYAVLPADQGAVTEGTINADNYTGTFSIPTAAYTNAFLTDASMALNERDKYVDLGLPSGLLWAICNVGAETPVEYGDYFAWGETTTKDSYNWSTYQHCNGSNNTLTKYCNNASYGYNGFTDDLTTPLPEDDAATANWGDDWRMPTKEEWQELRNNTTCTWTQQNGVNGRLFTASNGNSLFLPAAGYRYWGNPYSAGSSGYYWSSSLKTDGPDYAWLFNFDSSSNRMNDYQRLRGLSVRLVRNAE